MQIKRTLFSALAVLFMAQTTAWADENSADVTKTEVQQSSDPAAVEAGGDAKAPPGTTKPDADGLLKGGVKGAALRTEDGLARIGQAVVEVQASCVKIMKEATRKDTIVMRGPNMVGSVMLPPLGGQGGVMQFGQMPIRRDKLLTYIADSEAQLAALRSYLDALIIPDGKSDALSGVWAGMRSQMQIAEGHLQALKELSQAKKLVNGKIGKEALAIHDSLSSLDRSREQVLAIVQAQ